MDMNLCALDMFIMMGEEFLNFASIGGLAIAAIIGFKFLLEFVKSVQKQKREDHTYSKFKSNLSDLDS